MAKAPRKTTRKPRRAATRVDDLKHTESVNLSLTPRPIAEHGAIGNMETIALVGRDGTLDYMCWPYFDSPSIFAGLLDPEKGGVFELAPQIPDARQLQMYMPDTNVLLTRWLGEDCSAEVIDLMPTPEEDGSCPPRVVRRIRATRGDMAVRLRCAPRFDYARKKPSVTIDSGCVYFTATGGFRLRLLGAAAFRKEGDDAIAEFTLRAGEHADFVLDGGDAPVLDARGIEDHIHKTVLAWQSWTAESTYRGRWRAAVTRSALVLKLLTSRQYGSIAAAATFGLPEVPGGERNWDYRATWIRDASFTVYALMRLGYQKEAIAFTRWVGDRAEESSQAGRLRIMYAIDGSPAAREAELSHLEGYGGARPVRIGNEAANQEQLDIYGELLDSIYLSNKYGEAISHTAWYGVRRVVDYVCRHWRKPDAGIWEIRVEKRHHLHSRLMCWVAVDRAIRLADKRSLTAPFERWVRTRNEIYEDIWENFWDEEAGHFVSHKGSKDLDAALLMMPLMRFVSATDPRWLATLDEIGRQLTDEGLVFRYSHDDGLDGKEGPFAACSFWYIECLARAGRIDEARLNMEKVLHYANHLLLYAEEFDSRAGMLGNFPQAFTHLALISAAYYLDRELEPGRHKAEWRA